jgi:hypothetical protein
VSITLAGGADTGGPPPDPKWRADIGLPCGRMISTVVAIRPARRDEAPAPPGTGEARAS